MSSSYTFSSPVNITGALTLGTALSPLYGGSGSTSATGTPGSALVLQSSPTINNLNAGGTIITNAATPSVGTDVANKNVTDKIILQTALMRWGVTDFKTIQLDADKLFDTIENNDFIFYTADLSGNLTNPLRKWLISTKVLRFNFYCPAYNDALFLENLLLSQAATPNQKK